MSATEFEELTAELLRAMGYVDVKRVGKTADRGVDVEAYHVDQLGHRAKIIVQCKFYDKTTVPSGDMQQFAGALSAHKADRGIFITSSTFTREAVAYAELNPIILIDGDRLAELCEQYSIKQISNNKKRKPRKIKSRTYQDLYDKLSFGSNKGPREPFIIPNYDPLVLLKGFSHRIIYGLDIKLEDLEITNAEIQLSGLFVVDWQVNKVWHDSQGNQRNSWHGKGLYVTDENGDTVHDVGKSRPTIRKSKAVKYVNNQTHPDYLQLIEKFNVEFPKITRIPYKKHITIQGIPSKDIFCEPRKTYVASKIVLEYRYKGKKCSLISDCLSGKTKHKRPIFTKKDIRKIAVQERPELETVEFNIEKEGAKWIVTAETPQKIIFSIHSDSGNILTEKTHKEKILEKASNAAKKIFEDSEYNNNIQLNIKVGKTCKSTWTLDFSSKKGQIFVESNVDETMTVTPKINETYALELAQAENTNNSEFVNMTKDAKGYLFHFVDPQYDWKLHVDYQARKKITSKMLTRVEAVNRALHHLTGNDIDSPYLISKQEDTTKDLYKLKFRSEVDGEYDVEVYQSPSDYSCEIMKKKITQNRAQYLAEEVSKGEVFSVKKRYWGLGRGWDAIITGEKGQQRKIQINPNGDIIG